MPIYSYTLFKYLKSPSTWIVLAVSMFIAGFLGGWLPFHVVAAHNKDSLKVYSMTIIGVVGMSSSFLAIFISVFAGFKASSMYKDEVEDGTFLIMLSKPRTRGRIIFEKWLALQTVMIIYSFLTIVAFAIAVASNDPGAKIIPPNSAVSTITSKLFLVSLTMWAILIVIGFIFTSIALLLSTKVSVGATIGISVALGVVIPITSMVSMFTTDSKYESLKSNKLEMSKPMFTLGFKEIENRIEAISNEISSLPNSQAVTLAGAQKFLDQFYSFSKNDIYSNIEKTINGNNGLSDLGIATGQDDDFKKTYFFDLNYQVHSLSSMASDIVVPAQFAALTSNTKWGKLSGLPLTTKVTNEKPYTIGKEYNQMINAISENVEPIMKAAIKGQALINATGLFDYDDQYPWAKPKMTPEFAALAKDKVKVDDVNQLINFFHDLLTNPLSYVLDEDVLKANFDAEKFAFKEVNDDSVHSLIRYGISDVFKRDGIEDELQLKTIRMTSRMFSSTETTIENELLSVAHYDDAHNISSFVKVKKIPYANKFHILYIYLAIAIVLVPLSYFVVRKQDFR